MPAAKRWFAFARRLMPGRRQIGALLLLAVAALPIAFIANYTAAASRDITVKMVVPTLGSFDWIRPG